MQFTCLEKWIIFSVPTESKDKSIHKSGEKSQKNIFYRLKAIHSASFIVSSLSNRVNKLAEEFYKIKYKYGHHIRNM